MSVAFVLDPCFGPWIGIPLVILMAAGLLGDAFWNGAPERRLMRLLIRLALLAPLAVFLLRPTELNAETQQTQPTLAVIFDASKSLDLPSGVAGAAASGAPRRAPAELLHARTLAPLIAGLPGRHEAWSLNDSLHTLPTPPEKITVWPACGGGSALGDGLADLINGAAPARPGARCDAVILYTDGAITRGRPWIETIAQIQAANAPVYVFAVGDPGTAGPAAFTVDRLQGPDRVNAGEVARFEAIVRAPESFTNAVTPRLNLRLHWSLDGVERAVHELPAPQTGGLLNDELALPFPTPGLARVTLSVETPPQAPAALPPSVSRLVAVDPKKIRLLFWSMRLSRQTRGLEEQLARDSVLSVNVAGDYFRGHGLNLENALNSADVIVWEDPDLARLTPATLDLLTARLQDGVGLVLLSSPRLDLSKNAFLLANLPAQAGAPNTRIDAKPVVPAELRRDGFFGETPPVLPAFTGRLQAFDAPHDQGGYSACITTAEGQPMALIGHPGPGRSVAVLLTPDWPSDDETAAAASAHGSATPALGLGSLIRQMVHWTSGTDLRPGEAALRLKLSDDRPLPDQAVLGSLELANLDSNLLTAHSLQLVYFDQPAPAPAAPPSPAPAGQSTLATATPIAWQKVNGEIRFRVAFDRPGAFLVQARFSDGTHTLTDQVGVYVPGEELETTEPPDHAHLKQLAEATGGRFALASQVQPEDLATLKAALTARLTPQPSVQLGRISLGGGGITGALVIGCLLLEMLLRARRRW